MINTRDLELSNKPTMDNISGYFVYTPAYPFVSLRTIQFEFSSLKVNITVEVSVKEERTMGCRLALTLRVQRCNSLEGWYSRAQNLEYIQDTALSHSRGAATLTLHTQPNTDTLGMYYLHTQNMIGTHSASMAQLLWVSSALKIGQKSRPGYKIT